MTGAVMATLYAGGFGAAAAGTARASRRRPHERLMVLAAVYAVCAVALAAVAVLLLD